MWAIHFKNARNSSSVSTLTSGNAFSTSAPLTIRLWFLAFRFATFICCLAMFSLRSSTSIWCSVCSRFCWSFSRLCFFRFLLSPIMVSFLLTELLTKTKSRYEFCPLTHTGLLSRLFPKNG